MDLAYSNILIRQYQFQEFVAPQATAATCGLAPIKEGV